MADPPTLIAALKDLFSDKIEAASPEGLARLDNANGMQLALSHFEAVTAALLDLAETTHADRLWDRPMWDTDEIGGLQAFSTLLGAFSIWCDTRPPYIDPTPLHRLWRALTHNESLSSAETIVELRTAVADARIVTWRMNAVSLRRATGTDTQKVEPLPGKEVRWSRERLTKNWCRLFSVTSETLTNWERAGRLRPHPSNTTKKRRYDLESPALIDRGDA